MTAERLAPFQFRLELPPCQLYSALVMRCVDKNWNKQLLLKSQESIQGLKLHLGMTSSRLNREDTEHAHRASCPTENITNLFALSQQRTIVTITHTFQEFEIRSALDVTIRLGSAVEAAYAYAGRSFGSNLLQ
jgi:hypothetical protein